MVTVISIVDSTDSVFEYVMFSVYTKSTICMPRDCKKSKSSYQPHWNAKLEAQWGIVKQQY